VPVASKTASSGVAGVDLPVCASRRFALAASARSTLRPAIHASRSVLCAP